MSADVFGLKSRQDVDLPDFNPILSRTGLSVSLMQETMMALLILVGPDMGGTGVLLWYSSAADVGAVPQQ